MRCEEFSVSIFGRKQEVWEIDLSSEKEWQFGKKDHPCRKLPGEMPWLHRDLMDEAKRMSRVDKNVRGTANNEGKYFGCGRRKILPAD